VLKQVLHGVGVVLAGLVILVLLAAGAIWINAQRLMTQTHTNPVAVVTIVNTPAQIARGEYLVKAFPGCAGCHATDAAAEHPVLNGKLDEELGALATLYAPNLTPGGRLREWTDGEIIRAIREGISRDGRALMLMPSETFRRLSDDDALAIVAYLRSQPAVTNDTPVPRLTLLGTALVGTGVFKLDNQAPVQRVSAPVRATTAEYGKYLSETSGCPTCHGPKLDGADIRPGPPPGPSLQIVKGWTEDQFIKTMREGVDPVNRKLADTMPWRQYGRGTDDDLRALYVYLRSLP
jgi:mono/diheme cytochrome c family protein